MTSLTTKGLRVILAGCFLLAYGVVLNDLVIVGLGLVVFLFVVFSFLRYRRTLSGAIMVSPETLELRVVAGDTASEVLSVVSAGEYEITSEIAELSFEPGLVVSGENIVELVFSPVLGSVKTVCGLGFRVVEKYGLFSDDRSVSVEYRLVSYPRVYPVAAHALAALAEMGSTRGGSVSTTHRGDGTEYSDTRDYQPGDPLRRFDWKAYARTQRPMVKDYLVEGGGGTCIVYDNQADNPVSLDELNAAFLELVLSLTLVESQAEIRLLREEETYVLDRFNTLLLAIRIALEGRVEEFMGYYELLDPLSPRRGFMDKVLREKIYPNNFDQKSDTYVIVSDLSGHPVKILQTLESVSPDKTSLLVPSKPWLYQGTLERSNHIYERQMKYIRRIEKNGYKVYYKPRDLINVSLN